MEQEQQQQQIQQAEQASPAPAQGTANEYALLAQVQAIQAQMEQIIHVNSQLTAHLARQQAPLPELAANRGGTHHPSARIPSPGCFYGINDKRITPRAWLYQAHCYLEGNGVLDQIRGVYLLQPLLDGAAADWLLARVTLRDERYNSPAELLHDIEEWCNPPYVVA